MWQGIKDKAKNLITKHGSEVGAVAKVAAHVLLPGAPLLVSAVEAACDYSAEKVAEANDEALSQMLEDLGGDVAHLEVVLGHLGGQLDSVLSQMSMMSAFSTPEILEAMVNTALETQHQALRDEMRALLPELETVKRQQTEMLRQVALQGDMLEQVQDTLDAALAFNAPLAGEGIVGSQVSVFLAARGRFQSALLNADLSGAETALNDMKAISANGNTYRVSLMAFRAAKKDFAGAEQVAKTIVGAGANNPRVQRARHSLTKLTQARADLGRSNALDGQNRVSKQYQAGDQIGDRGWTLTALLGQGGMASVWRAKNSRGQEGAVKLMNAVLSQDSQFVSRFQAEIDALDKVNHPAVIDILDWGQDRVHGAWYFVMPFIKGSSLRSSLRGGAMEEGKVKELVKKVLAGLAACHAERVIHRDIKPENIMLKLDGSPVLIDFGIAHQEGVGTGQTQMATYGYAPPEQLAGRQVDGTADLYALGMTVAECLGPKADEAFWDDLISAMTHRKPSRRGTAQSILAQLSEAPKKYFSIIPGQDSKGPFTLKEVCAQVLAGTKDLHLWWEGQGAWQKWDTVSEVKTNVDKQRKPTPPPLTAQMTPPPPPPLILKPQPKAGELSTRQIKGQAFKFCHIPAGSFWMGTDDGGPDEDEDEQPRHQVKISKAFWLGQTPVTQEQWTALMGSNPSHFADTGSNLPVEKVSWFDCVRYCNKLSEADGYDPVYRIGSGDEPTVEADFGRNGYRLPTEAEWEYAAKAGTELIYAGSDDIDEVAWYDNNAGEQTMTVAQLMPNAWGLYDMSGNVYEWCSDQWNRSAYKGRTNTTIDPHEWTGSASSRVLRGGCWSLDSGFCRVAYRYGFDPDLRWYGLGLRLLRCEP